MYFVQMVNISNGQITDSRNIAIFDSETTAKDQIKGNYDGIFIKGENSYYDYAILCWIEAVDGWSNTPTWFKYNRSESDVTVDSDTIKRVLINIEEVSAPTGFEDYAPSLLD